MWWKSHRNPKEAPYKSRRGRQENWTKYESKALVKERRKAFGRKSSQKKAGHKRGPKQQSYYWRSGSIMGFWSWLRSILWKNLFGSKKNGARKLRNKSYSIGKGNIILDNFSPQKKLDTIENPRNNHTIEDQGCSWTTPLKNCLGAMF